jgi:hypothetical protein
MSTNSKNDEIRIYKNETLSTEDVYAIGRCLIEWLGSIKGRFITYEEQSSVMRIPKIIAVLNKILEDHSYNLIKLPRGFDPETFSFTLSEYQ